MSLRSRLLRLVMVGGAVVAFWDVASAQQSGSPALPPALGQGTVPGPKPATPPKPAQPPSATSQQTQGPTSAPKDPVVATINGQPLHLSELEIAQQSLPQQYRNLPLKAVFPRLLHRAVDSEI